MYREDPNIVIQTGNLTRNPELRTSPGGTKIANLRVGVNSRRKVGDEWVDKPNFFTLVCFGTTAENAFKYLKQGRRVMYQGRLDWSEYEKDGDKREGVQIIVDQLHYLPTRTSIEEQMEAERLAAASGQMPIEGEGAADPAAGAAGGEAPPETGQPVGVGAGEKEEEIPF